MTSHPKTQALMKRGADFLGSETAILCGAMSWVSERNLVSAISNAGGFGVIACGAMTPELLDAEIAATKALATKPFGVNLITMHPQLFELIEVCAKHGVGHVVLAGGIPPKGSVEAIKAGIGEPIGSLTQMGTIRLGKRTEKRTPIIKEFVPLAGLDDLVFGGWDIFGENAYDSAVHAGVLKQDTLNAIKEPLHAIRPWEGVFDRDYVRRLDGTHVKEGGRGVGQ